MPERELLLERLERFAIVLDGILPKCAGLVRDAITMLKEQEPKQIVRKQGKHENSDGSIDYFAEWYCPHCGKLLNRGFDTPWIEFCYMCGRPVKWK